MTEEEAKTKWCPHVRYPNLMDGGMVASNRYSDGCNVNAHGDRTPPAFCCATSDCMMWQQTDNECIPQTDETKQQTCKPAGYCGLAK